MTRVFVFLILFFMFSAFIVWIHSWIWTIFLPFIFALPPPLRFRILLALGAASDMLSAHPFGVAILIFLAIHRAANVTDHLTVLSPFLYALATFTLSFLAVLAFGIVRAVEGNGGFPEFFARFATQPPLNGILPLMVVSSCIVFVFSQKRRRRTLSLFSYAPPSRLF